MRRISKSQQKRMDALAAPHDERERRAIYAVATFKGVDKVSAEQLAKLTPAQRGLFKVNEIAPIPGSAGSLSLDDWSAMAEASQAELCAATTEDREPYKARDPDAAPPAPASEPALPDPADVSARYKPMPGKLEKALSRPQVLR